MKRRTFLQALGALIAAPVAMISEDKSVRIEGLDENWEYQQFRVGDIITAGGGTMPDGIYTITETIQIDHGGDVMAYVKRMAAEGDPRIIPPSRSLNA